MENWIDKWAGREIGVLSRAWPGSAPRGLEAVRCRAIAGPSRMPPRDNRLTSLAPRPTSEQVRTFPTMFSSQFDMVQWARRTKGESRPTFSTRGGRGTCRAHLPSNKSNMIRRASSGKRGRTHELRLSTVGDPERSGWSRRAGRTRLESQRCGAGVGLG